jgi:hypothetical protein
VTWQNLSNNWLESSSYFLSIFYVPDILYALGNPVIGKIWFLPQRSLSDARNRCTNLKLKFSEISARNELCNTLSGPHFPPCKIDDLFLHLFPVWLPCAPCFQNEKSEQAVQVLQPVFILRALVLCLVCLPEFLIK